MVSPPGGHPSVLRAQGETTDQLVVRDKQDGEVTGQTSVESVLLYTEQEGREGVGRLWGCVGYRKALLQASLFYFPLICLEGPQEKTGGD